MFLRGIGAKSTGWLVLLAAGFCLVGQAALAAHNWRTYRDSAQHFSGCYPADLFTSEDPPQAGEPENFMASDGAEASMYVTADEHGESLGAELRDAEAGEFSGGGKPVFQMVRHGFYLFVGFADGTVVYEKAILKDGYFETFRISYPKVLHRNYDPVAKRMASCFVAG